MRFKLVSCEDDTQKEIDIPSEIIETGRPLSALPEKSLSIKTKSKSSKLSKSSRVPLNTHRAHGAHGTHGAPGAPGTPGAHQGSRKSKPKRKVSKLDTSRSKKVVKKQQSAKKLSK